MRRWFAIFLLVLLPLQALWAAAAPYCAHEESPASMHIGHHTHEHQGPEQDLSGSDGPGAIHTDCHVCHGVGGAVAAPVLACGPGESRATLPASGKSLPKPPVFPPDRPNWARLA